MRRFQQIAPGVALSLFGCLVAASVLQGCQPGKLCDKEEYSDLCANPPTGGTGGGGVGGGGSGGGGTGGGGSGGNRDGGAMEMAAAPVNDDTPVADCADYNTLGKMDTFFAMRCGSDGACHTSPGATAWTDMKMPKVYSRLLNVAPKFACTADKMIDPGDWSKSVLLVKVRDAMPLCKNGSKAGTTVMPPPLAAQAQAMKQDPLTDAEKTCLENFVRAAAGK
jgi:hypothetical protein